MAFDQPISGINLAQDEHVVLVQEEDCPVQVHLV